MTTNPSGSEKNEVHLLENSSFNKVGKYICCLEFLHIMTGNTFLVVLFDSRREKLACAMN